MNHRKKFYLFSIFGFLTMLLGSSIAHSNFTASNSLQKLEDNPVTLHPTAENNALLWDVTWGGTSGDRGESVAIGPDGAIYVAGSTASFGAGSNDFALVKFHPNGTKAWNVTWGGASSDEGFDVAIGADGALYVAGGTASFGAGGLDLALVKFHPNGTKAWNVTWGGGSVDRGESVAIGADGALYVAGYTASFGAGSDDSALVKFYPNGTKAWNVTWGGASDDHGESVAIGADGALYVAGGTASFGAGGLDLALVKFHPNGTKAWNVTWGGASGAFGESVAIGPDGALYVAGSTASFGAGSNDFALVRFHPNGTKAWNVTWGGASSDEGFDVAIGADGALYVAGRTWSFGAGNYDLALVKFHPDGTQAWDGTWGGIANDFGESVAIGADGALYVAGSTASFGAGSDDLALVKFRIPSESGGIPGFDFLCLVIGLLALVHFVHRRSLCRGTS
ncbi:MAG: hypothetical protein ACTSQ8_10845 [Candidatus Helarchaeota archaeon]